MATVLLATDGSEHARRAADRAVEMALDRDADLEVISVVDRRKFGEPALSADELTAIAAGDRGSRHVNEVTAMAERAGVTARGRVCHGVPHDAIVEHAAAAGADAIVVGEHGDHQDHIGGVGRRVAAMADCDVVVVPTRPRIEA